MNKIFATFFLMISFNGIAFAQYEERERKKKVEEDLSELSFRERSFWGGNLSFNWSSYNANFGVKGLYLEVSPLLGYRLNPSFAAGIMATYKYYRGVNTYYGLVYDTHVWGGGLFARMHMGDKFYLQGELEALNTEAYSLLQQKFIRKFISVASIGIGYGPKGESYSYGYVQLSYDLVGDKDSPYPASPLIPKIGMIIPFNKKD